MILTATAEAATAAGTNELMGIFPILQLALGLYALYAGISGNGSVYKNSYPKSKQAMAHRITRIFLLVMAPILILSGTIELAGWLPSNFNAWVQIGISAMVIIAFIAYVILLKKKCGKQ